jgi:hypothetical protein
MVALVPGRFGTEFRADFEETFYLSDNAYGPET